MVTRISTGLGGFDEFLGGGIEVDAITTLYGASGTGKTNLCMHCCTNTVKEGLRVVYIDCDGGFSVERLRQLTPDYDLILSNILFLKPTSFASQKTAMKRLERLLKDLKSKKVTRGVGLIVVDAFTNWYRLALSKRKSTSEVNKELISQISFLDGASRSSKIPIILTTAVYSDPTNRSVNKIVGGDILRNASKTLLEFEKLKGPNRKMIIRKHRSLKEDNELLFEISQNGLQVLRTK